MASVSAKMFMALMDEREMSTQVVDDEKSVIRCRWKLDNTALTLFFFFNEEGNYVAMVGREFVKIPRDRYEVTLDTINQLNMNYKFVKFILDKDEGELIIKADAVTQLDSCAEEAFELMVRATQIVDDAYPVIMKSLWA